MSGVAGGDQDREMAERSTILRAVTGSTAHGLNLPGTDDRDELGICLEDLESFTGFSEFENYIYRSAAAREGKSDAPSQPGDLDLTIYSLKKFLRLAMQGNPSVLNLLFVKDFVKVDANGWKVQEWAPLIVSRQAGKRYLGYMESQRQRLLGERGQKKVNRPELEAKFGFDTKYAMHILRLGFQGVELLTTGKITLPMPEKEREFVFGVRQGKYSLHETLTQAGELERELKDLIDSSELPEHPNRELLEKHMIDMYWGVWKARRHPW